MEAAEQSLSAAQIDLKSLAGNAPVGIAIFLGERLMVDTANKAYLEIIGKTAEEFVGKPLLESMPELIEQGIGEILLKVLRTGEPFIGQEFSAKIQRHGELGTAYFNFIYQPLYDTSRMPKGVMVLVNEVTDYVTTRQKLAEEEERSRLAIEAADIGTFDWEIAPDTFIYSPRLASIFGYSDNKNLTHGDFSELIFVEDRVIRDLAHQEARNSGVLNYEARVQWPDGSLHWVRLSGKITFKDNVPYKMHGIAIDITKEKQALQSLEDSELRLRLATESAELGTFDIDLRSNEVFHSERYLQIMGRPDAGSWTRDDFMRCVHPEDLGIVNSGRARAFETGKLDYEVRVVWPDRSVHWIRKKAQVLFDEQKKPCRMLGTLADVTDQKSALLESVESEKRFRAVADNAPVMIWMADTDKQCYFLNAGWLRFTGRSSEQEMGDGWVQGIHPDDRAKCNQAYDEAFEKRSEFYIEYRLRRHDGVYRWVADKGIPRFSPEGTFLGYIGSCQDIHEKVEAQGELEKQVAERTLELTRRNKELQQHKDFVDTILDSSVDVIAVFDMEQRFLSVNKRYEEAYKVRSADLIGKRMTDVFPQAAGKAMHKGLQKALQGESMHEPVYKSAINNRYTELFCVPLKDGEHVYAAMAIAHDVTDMLISSESLYEMNQQLETRNTELAISEDRYHKMIDEVKDYVIIFIDKDGRVQNWNKGAQKIKGYDEQDVLGKSFEIFYPEEDRKNNLPGRFREEAIAKGRASSEGWRIKKDGTAFWAGVVLTALYDESNSLIGFTKVTRDLTERKLADDRLKNYAEELQHKNRELERSNQELVSFSYVASHDLQEPLRKINTFSEQILLKEFDKLSDSGKGYFQRMQNSISRMQTLIQDLLEYSRINTSERKFELTDLNLLLQEVRSEFHERLEEKKTVFESDVLPVIDIIPFQFKQLFNNIISNAIKFAKQDTPLRISVSYNLVDASAVDENASKAARKFHMVSLSDNGIGFDDQYKNRIFQIFQRLHGKNEYAGTGIGLSICQRVVQNHNGYIKATGEEGKGATFQVFLPAN